MTEYDVASESPYAFLGEEETRAWYAYMKVHLRLRYEMDHQLRGDHGISLADYDVLVALVSDPERTLSVSDLATRIGSERSRVSHQLRSLSARGLVTLAIDPDDRRVTRVALSDRGDDTLADVSPRHIDFVRSVFFDALTPPQVQEMSTMFEGIYDQLIRHGTLPRPVDRP